MIAVCLLAGQARGQDAPARKILLPLIWDGEPVGAVHVDGRMRVDAADLLPWIGAHMTPEALTSFKALAAGGLCDPAAATPGEDFEEWLRHE